MFKLINNYLRNIKNYMRSFFFLRNYRKDTPESTQRFYNMMKYIYRSEFITRVKFNKTLVNSNNIENLNKKGFLKLKLSDISRKKEFINLILKFRKRFDEMDHNLKENIHKKDYLIQYDFEFNKDIKILTDPFVDIATKYLGTLPILESLQLWYSPNNSSDFTGSRLLHRDPEDFKQLKIFIPIEEVKIENGPLCVIDKHESEKLYEDLISKRLITQRNQKIDDKYATKLNLTSHPVLLQKDECALVDTCACYHFGSRMSSKPRKILFLHFTSAFSAKTPIFRNYDSEKNFFSEKDKLVYGLHKKTINHYKKKKYLTI